MSNNVVRFPPRLELDPKKILENEAKLSALVSSLGISSVALPYIGHLAFIAATEPSMILKLIGQGFGPSEIASRLLERATLEIEAADLDEELMEAGIDPGPLRALAEASRDDQPLI